MRQTSNQKQSASFMYYFFLGAYLAVEPFFLKLFFKTYLPDLYYPVLTVPISVILSLVGFQKFRKTFGGLTIKQTLVVIVQVYIYLFSSKFRKQVLSYSQFHLRVLLDLLLGLSSQEQTVHVRSKKAVKYYIPIDIFASVSLICIGYLFLVNLSQWGLFETSFTISFYLFIICLLTVALTSLPQTINAAKMLRNARRSESDLDALLKLLRKELKGWHFKYRVVLPSADSKNEGDIDVIAISPDKNNFIIELKSHIGKIIWNSELKKLCQQLGKDPEPKPFKRDFFNDLNKQAKLLRNAWDLSQSPNKVLIFWRAEVRISSKKRLQRGVKISEKSRIVKDLEKRNRKLVEKKQNGVPTVNGQETMLDV